MRLNRAMILAALALSLTAGCGDSGSDTTNIINSLFRGTLNYTAEGGGASGNATSAFGGAGGSLGVQSRGNILVGVNPAPLAPALPAVPVTGAAVASWTNIQTINSGNAIVNGAITADTTGTAATLNVSTGDLVINGSITSADNGGIETNLVINVPAGTVWISGTLRTGNVDGTPSGDNGGFVQITALRIIFTGTIDTRGENDAAGGAGSGGSVIFDTEGAGTGQTSQLLVGGSMNMSGGNATGSGAAGGSGGTFQSYVASASNGAVHIQGTNFALNGGSATGTGAVSGGSGGYLDLQGNAGVFFNGTYSGNGGDAVSSDGDALGGNAGGFYENDLAIAESGPCAVFGSINVSGGAASGGPAALILGGDAGFIDVNNGSDANLGAGTCSLLGADSSGSGGEGGTADFFVDVGVAGDIYFDGVIDVSDGSGAESVQGGNAGSVSFTTSLGDIQISGSLLLDGGHGSSSSNIFAGPSTGGNVFVVAGDGTVAGGGSITFRGSIQANGGSDGDGADDNDGARGGVVQFICSNPAGSIYLDPGSSIQLDGGNAGGTTSAPFGGDGGTVQLATSGGSTSDGTVGGNISMRGSILARGGSGLGIAGSFGGLGGSVGAESDSPAVGVGGADGRGGDITLHAGATIDVSGGFGGSGGDALNDLASGVTVPVAVIFDADGLNSDDPGENGIVQNLGTIIGRGAVFDGNGGDVLFDGLTAALAVGPSPGALDLSGSGAGFLGDFLSQ
jgi:hypothetical protein